MSDSSLLKVDLDGGRSAFEPGETISGEASWQVDRADSVQVRLFWFTSGRGTRDAQIIDSITVTEPSQVGRSRFSFRLPTEPYSISGKLISLTWAIEMVIEPGERSTRAEFMMAPGGSAIVLETSQADRA